MNMMLQDYEDGGGTGQPQLDRAGASPSPTIQDCAALATQYSKCRTCLGDTRSEGRDEVGLSSKTVLKIQALKKTYGLKPILRSIDLTIQQGERVALLGANGAGKTTILRILAGLTRPSAGAVSVEGFDILKDAQQVRRLVGIVAHQPYLYEELTALENLLFFGRMYSVNDARERAYGLLQRVGLEKRVRERVGTFSRGQIQRLSWARALLHAPHLLLLDEPDTGLDQAGHAVIDALLVEHTDRGGATLFTTHQLERALELGTRVVLLNGGRIVYQQETASIALEEMREIYQRVCQETSR